MTDTPTLEDTVEHLDFEHTDEDYSTTLEAVKEYGEPLVEAGEFPEQPEQTLVTGRTVSTDVLPNRSSFEDMTERKYEELAEIYTDLGLSAKDVKKDLTAAFGVALVDRVDENSLEAAQEQACKHAAGEILDPEYVSDCVNAAQEAYNEATSQETSGTGGVVDHK